MAKSTPIKINRAPVLTLWAAVVAERLGNPPGDGAQPGQRRGGHRRAKARRLGIAEESDQAKERAEAAPRPAEGSARLLGKTIRLTHDEDGVVLADGGGKPAPAAPVRAYVAKAFGDHLAEARKALEDLAARYEPEELNRVGFRLYERFRPEVPPDVRGWGAKGVLDLEKIPAAGDLSD